MKKRKITKTYVYSIILLLTIISLITLYLTFSNVFNNQYTITTNQKDIRKVKPIETNTKDLKINTLDILPSNFEEVLSKNDIDLNYEELVYFLNNGHIFIEKDIQEINQEEHIKKTDTYIDISSIYNELSNSNNQIYVSSQTLSHYFTNSFKDIKNSSIEYDSLRKTLRRKAIDIQTRMAFSGGDSLIEKRGIYSLPLFQKERLENIARYSDIEIIVENDIDNYTYIQKQIEEVSSSFPQFKNLLNEIYSIKKYLSNDDITNEKLVIVEILEKVKPIVLEKDEGFVVGNILKNVNNSLVIFPYISNDEDILSRDINNENFTIDYDLAPLNQTVGTVRIPVLMYHHIGSPPEGSTDFKKGLYVETEMFEKQIAYLTRKNYRSISTEEFYNILQTGQNPTQKTIVISFDDSLLNHYTKAFPILKKYGHVGIFFVPTQVGLLPREQLMEMSNMGMDIQSHSATHPILTRVSNRTILEREISGSKNTLEELTGKPVNAFAYPGCVGNRIVFNMVLDSGYNLGFSCGRLIDHNFDERVVISRTQVYNDMNQFLTILSGTY